MDTGLTGRSALVTASTSGLGLAIAQGLASEGARVTVAGRRGEKARAEADQMGSAVGIEIDLQDPDSAQALVQQATEAFGAPDVLVLNSGGPPPGGANGLDRAGVLAAVETLLFRQVEIVSLVLPAMRERGWGRIVAVGSSGVQSPLPNLALSNIGRAGLAAYLKTLATEVAADGVTVNMVLPGRIDTERVASLDGSRAERENLTVEEARARSEASIPAKRYGTPEEFASVVTYLCSTAASYVTGEQVRCDGGLVGSY